MKKHNSKTEILVTESREEKPYLMFHQQFYNNYILKKYKQNYLHVLKLLKKYFERNIVSITSMEDLMYNSSHE